MLTLMLMLNPDILAMAMAAMGSQPLAMDMAFHHSATVLPLVTPTHTGPHKD